MCSHSKVWSRFYSFRNENAPLSITSTLQAIGSGILTAGGPEILGLLISLFDGDLATQQVSLKVGRPDSELLISNISNPEFVSDRNIGTTECDLCRNWDSPEISGRDITKIKALPWTYILQYVYNWVTVYIFQPMSDHRVTKLSVWK